MLAEHEDLNIKTRIKNILRNVYDPELGINIVDLGLIYDIKYSLERGIEVVMTLTSPSCPMGEMITETVEQTLSWNFPGMPVMINIVFDPEWHPDMISKEGRELL